MLLPRSLAPLPDESLAGFLLRLAFRLDLAPTRLAEAVGLATGRASRIQSRFLLALDPDTVARFAAATRLSLAEAHALTLATLRTTYPPVDPGFGFHRRHGGVTGRTIAGILVQEHWILSRSSRYCPDCLAGDGSTIQHYFGGGWNKLWHLPVVFACPVHQRLLEHACRRCGQPAMGRNANDGLITNPATSALHPTACRNSHVTGSGAHRVCGWRLDTPTATSASGLDLPALLGLQDHLLHRLHHNDLTVSVGGPATPAQYFIDLRILACLITASWPAARPLISDQDASDLIDGHAAATRHRIEQVRNSRNRARDHAFYDTPPTTPTATAALLATADAITRTGSPDAVRDLLEPLIKAAPDGHNTWIKQFLRGTGCCSSGLQTALGPAVGAAHIVASTGIASWTGKRSYPRPRSVRFDLRHIPQRIPAEWIDTYFTAFADLLPRPLHHAIAGRLAQMVLGGPATKANAALAVTGLGMSHWATTVALDYITRRFADTGRQPAFDKAINDLADHLDAQPAPTDYARRRTALADWSIPPADWKRLTDGLPTAVQTGTWHWQHVEWTEPNRILSSVWVWYHATSGDRTYNPHMRRDSTKHGRLGPTAKYVSTNWNQLTNHVRQYQQLRERLDPYIDEILQRIDADRPLDR